MSRRLIRAVLLVLMFGMSIAALPARAESPERRDALKLCRKKYNETLKGAKYLKGADRKARMTAAREERRKCKALAPER